MSSVSPRRASALPSASILALSWVRPAISPLISPLSWLRSAALRYLSAPTRLPSQPRVSRRAAMSWSSLPRPLASPSWPSPALEVRGALAGAEAVGLGDASWWRTLGVARTPSEAPAGPAASSSAARARPQAPVLLIIVMALLASLCPSGQVGVDLGQLLVEVRDRRGQPVHAGGDAVDRGRRRAGTGVGSSARCRRSGCRGGRRGRAGGRRRSRPR